MAAVLKKRALAEYTQTQEVPHQPTLKKLRLVKKPVIGSSAIAFVNLLEKCKNSNEALQALLRISDCLEFESTHIPEAIRKISDYFKVESESAVRVKILSLFADIGCEQGADVTSIIEETILLLKNEKSHKVIAQGISTIQKLASLITDNPSYHVKLVEIAKNYLKDVSHSVKCHCLNLIGNLLPIGTNSETESVLKLVGNHFFSEDARVRSEAFSTMICFHERGFKINPDMYTDVITALKDDYEIVRQVALKLVWVLGNTYPENIIILPDSDQELRMIDDAFGKVCNAVNDLSMCVRTLAAQLLGSMKLVSPRFLHQTLDKKLMSNMRKKCSAHELAWENVTSGEWASGKKWADDAPRELVDAESVSLMTSGACGAFVHGLEDEYYEVRTAAVESMCELSLNNSDFAVVSLDFLVDMLSDEIEDVRIKAIDSLRRISKYIVLREDQLETILGALEDFSYDVREGLHRMLACSRLATMTCLQLCVEKLLDNLRKYPQDKRSTYRCLQKIGSQHPNLTLPLVPQLLSVHPFFDTAEPDVDTPSYICILILVFNAAQHCPTMIDLFEQHTLRHYSYLRDTMPSLVPVLKLADKTSTVKREIGQTESQQFLETIINNLDIISGSTRVRMTLLETAQIHLKRLAEMDEGVSGAAEFTALYIGAQLLMVQILNHELWTNAVTLASQQEQMLRNNIQQLLQHCLKLEHLFVNLSPTETCLIKQFRLKVLAIHLVFVVRGSNASALAPCHHLLSAAEETERELAARGVEPEPFTAAVFRDLAGLEDPKPGPVARLEHLFVNLSPTETCLIKQFRLKVLAIHLVFVVRGSNASALAPCHHLLSAAEETERELAARGVEPEPFTAAVFRDLAALEDPKPGPVARCLLPLMLGDLLGKPPKPNVNIQMSKATIIEPTGQNDSALKFTAGLIMAVPLEAELTNLADPSRLRLKVKYPDQRTQIMVPRVNELRQLESEAAEGDGRLRLATTVLVSHQVWTEACFVYVNIALAVPEADLTRRKAHSDSSACLLDLCKPVKVCVAPKPVKKGIL